MPTSIYRLTKSGLWPASVFIERRAAGPPICNSFDTSKFTERKVYSQRDEASNKFTVVALLSLSRSIEHWTHPYVSLDFYDFHFCLDRVCGQNVIWGCDCISVTSSESNKTKKVFNLCDLFHHCSYVHSGKPIDFLGIPFHRTLQHRV